VRYTIGFPPSVSRLAAVWGVLCGGRGAGVQGRTSACCVAPSLLPHKTTATPPRVTLTAVRSHPPTARRACPTPSGPWPAWGTLPATLLAHTPRPSPPPHRTQGVSNIMWALASVGHVDARLMGRLARHCRDQLPSYDVQALANCLWACATLGYREPGFVGALAQVRARGLWGRGAVGARVQARPGFVGRGRRCRGVCGGAGPLRSTHLDQDRIARLPACQCRRCWLAWSA